MPEQLTETTTSPTFCALPWLNLHTHSDGRMKLCCHVYDSRYIEKSDHSKDPALLSEQPLSEIWNGRYMATVREKMLAGAPVRDCSRCYELEKAGLKSARQMSNEEYASLLPEDLSAHHAPEPILLELRFGNSCNLNCSGCWAPSSSSIYKERKNALQNYDLPHWIRQSWSHEVAQVDYYDWEWFKSENFKDFILQSSGRLKRVYLTGGEPTLIRENIFLLQSLLDAGNRECHIALTTNLTIWPQEFYDLLKNFQSVEIQMSIDGIKAASEYIRYPCKWNIIERNFQRAIQLPDTFTLKIYTLVQAWNILRLSELFDWYLQKESIERVHMAPIFLENPDFLNAAIWPQKELDAVVTLMDQYKNGMLGGIAQKIQDYISGKEPPREGAMFQMIEYIKIQDLIRKSDFSAVFKNEMQIILRSSLKSPEIQYGEL